VAPLIFAWFVWVLFEWFTNYIRTRYEIALLLVEFFDPVWVFCSTVCLGNSCFYPELPFIPRLRLCRLGYIVSDLFFIFFLFVFCFVVSFVFFCFFCFSFLLLHVLASFCLCMFLALTFVHLLPGTGGGRGGATFFFIMLCSCGCPTLVGAGPPHLMGRLTESRHNCSPSATWFFFVCCCQCYFLGEPLVMSV